MSSKSSTHMEQLQNDLKTVLKSWDGKVQLADLPSRWEATHGTRLSLAAYGVSNISSLLDRCRTICRYVSIPVQSYLKNLPFEVYSARFGVLLADWSESMGCR